MNAETSEDRIIPPDWYRYTFGALYPMIYAHRTPEAAAPEATFAAQCTQLEKTDAVLDLCCGGGRHMAALAGKTNTLTGLDYSPELLRLAKQALPAEARLVRGDMRNLPFAATFDVVLNFFTSFGYFQTREENLAVLREMARVLRPGGRFFFDYFSAEHTRRYLRPDSERALQNYRIVEHRWIDLALRRINKSTRVWKEETLVAKFGESVSLYTPDELLAMFDEAGLEPDAQFGDYEGHPIAMERPRVIVAGHRKA